MPLKLLTKFNRVARITTDVRTIREVQQEVECTKKVESPHLPPIFCVVDLSRP